MIWRTSSREWGSGVTPPPSAPRTHAMVVLMEAGEEEGGAPAGMTSIAAHRRVMDLHASRSVWQSTSWGHVWMRASHRLRMKARAALNSVVVMVAGYEASAIFTAEKEAEQLYQVVLAAWHPRSGRHLPAEGRETKVYCFILWLSSL